MYLPAYFCIFLLISEQKLINAVLSDFFKVYIKYQ